MGFQKIGEEGNRLRFSAPGRALGNHIDLLIDPNAKFGRSGAGSVHHIAFRAKDDAAQKEWRQEIAKHLDVTPVLDRKPIFTPFTSVSRVACLLRTRHRPARIHF